jgi:two-component system response regulator YesN
MIKMLKVLIADDNTIIRQSLIKRITWEQLGMECIGEASNGLETVEFFKKNTPDIIITDIKMPKKDGFFSIGEIRKKYPDIQFIIISGYDDFEYMKKALQFEVVDYLLKPIDNQELHLCLEKAKSRFIKSQKITSHMTDIASNSLESIEKMMNEKRDSLVIEKVIQYIDRNFTDPITVKSLGNKFFMNHIYLGQLIKKHTGESFNSYINKKRLLLAAQILKEKEVIVLKDLAFSLGYADSHYFTKLFKEFYGMTATEYKNKL